VPTKPLFWVGTSLEDLRAFPADWKPMATVGSGLYELRIRTRQEHRVFYIAKLPEGVYVLHAFEKRSRKTPQADIELARARLSQLVRQRRMRKE